MRRGLTVTVTVLALAAGSAMAADGLVTVPGWVSDEQTEYTVRCDRQVASSLANVDWELAQHVQAEHWVAAHPGTETTYGTVGWHRYWERVDRQLHRQLLRLCP